MACRLYCDVCFSLGSVVLLVGFKHGLIVGFGRSYKPVCFVCACTSSPPPPFFPPCLLCVLIVFCHVCCILECPFYSVRSVLLLLLLLLLFLCVCFCVCCFCSCVSVLFLRVCSVPSCFILGCPLFFSWVGLSVCLILFCL